ncbi:hypothetical protein NA66_1001733 [Burkholderia pyrrocinia]|uniref:Uncharacterized protein n=1 Tax=Burkholderia pyrrocinia TaxID=60550 RepID=A0A318J1Y8_BURPY|nr:hypothetical protein NA66_1001733 [Burkholderia pyrrocinia]
MSLYQCEHCGCCENTALGHYWAAITTCMSGLESKIEKE